MKNIKSMKAFESYDTSDDVDRLYSILEEIQTLMSEADGIINVTSRNVGDPIIYERWKAYPYGNIMAMLGGGSKYDTSFSDIIKDIENEMGVI